MEHKPTGLAPGAVMSKGSLIAYAMKIRLEDSTDELFYLGEDRIVELLKALAIKTQQLHAKGSFSLDEVDKATNIAEQKYRKQNVQLTQNELESPSPGNVVHQLNAEIRDDSLLLSIIKHDNRIVDIRIPDPEIEIFTGYMLNTLKKVGGDSLINQVIAKAGI